MGVLFLAPVTILPSPRPLFHFIFLLSVSPLCASSPAAAIVLFPFFFFIVSYKNGAQSAVNRFARLHMLYSQFGAALRMKRKRRRWASSPCQPLSSLERRVNRDGGAAAFTSVFSCANLPIQHRRKRQEYQRERERESGAKRGMK